MAISTAYKNIGIGVETTYGASVALSAYLPIKSVNLDLDPNFSIKEDTSASFLGFDRSGYMKNVIEGNIEVNVDPITVGHWLRLGFGGGVTVGTGFIPNGGATAMGFLQNTNGILSSYRLDYDQATAVKTRSGIVSKSFEIKSSGEWVEMTLDVSAKGGTYGPTLTATGVTVNPFVFAETNVYYGATITGCTIPVSVEDWSFKYDLQTEITYLSGNRDVGRVDPKIPRVEGQWKRFFDDTNFEGFMSGQTEKALRIDIVGSQQYSGTTAYRLQIFIPRARITKTETPYEATALNKESVMFTALYDSNVGYMARAVLHNGQASL